MPRFLLLAFLVGCWPSSSAVIDVDGDGHPVGEDCDDANAGAWQKWCPDTDADGAGNATPGFTPTCGPVAGTAYTWAPGCA